MTIINIIALNYSLDLGALSLKVLWYITIGKPNYNEIPANDPTKFKKEEKSGTKKAIKNIKNVNANL